MIKVTCFVIRDNKRLEVNSSDVVVGDIIALESGMKICADARIIESYNFQVKIYLPLEYSHQSYIP